ncbi:histidine phosphatase family protein [Paenibacillus sp. MMS18-CY102]|uniref:histidine phosphatase family protein n=1 Tax=Paenibacillus sp. MMS18-CY102 TaxID=2682849 RepID=UPI001365549F|nr:histidine phosphatase family protein [Paenibacillus sp. MMS18-CY102]MWC27670.1 histidine phosphatase family protein [Paenibacillus sp. MMS18-CY102]
MQHIYVVRHCKAEGQAPDAPLTAEGVKQAEQLAAFLSGRAIDYVVSSPYERAYRTIAPLAERLGIEVVLDARLTERVLSGTSHPDWRDRLRRSYEELDLCYDGGESSNAAMNRAVGVVKDVLEGGHQNAVMVSHGNLISLLLKHFDGQVGFKEWELLSNPDVFQLSFEKGAPSMQRIWTE